MTHVEALPSAPPPHVPVPQPSPEATPCAAVPEPATPPAVLKGLAYTVCSPGSPHRHLMQPRGRLSPDGTRPSIPAVVQLKRAAFEPHAGSTPVLPAQRPRVDSVIPIADADLGAADPAAPSATPTTSPPNGVSVDAVCRCLLLFPKAPSPPTHPRTALPFHAAVSRMRVALLYLWGCAGCLGMLLFEMTMESRDNPSPHQHITSRPHVATGRGCGVRHTHLDRYEGEALLLAVDTVILQSLLQGASLSCSISSLIA